MPTSDTLEDFADLLAEITGLAFLFPDLLPPPDGDDWSDHWPF